MTHLGSEAGPGPNKRPHSIDLSSNKRVRDTSPDKTDAKDRQSGLFDANLNGNSPSTMDLAIVSGDSVMADGAGTGTATLEALQTEDQRRVLDTISQVRKCGLDSILSLPQIVVCGDQSAGKSSVLEALTEIPFPRNDDLCTRFATEISLRREQTEKLTIKVIPDGKRPATEQVDINAFSATITDFSELPVVMEAAMAVMGVKTESAGGSGGSPFAKDTLSIEIAGPNRPQLTLVDIPGLIQASTKGVSAADVAMVGEITDQYISQPRTICLAVISATNDAANQPILERVRKFDPQGNRTLGVITKPDLLPAGSGSEAKFLELARNEDVFFKLGWHVIKNRKFEEKDYSFDARNESEDIFFMTSNFSCLPKESVGIDTLRERLSLLLFEHVKNELPRLKDDLDKALIKAQADMAKLGLSRKSAVECRSYLTHLSMECRDICTAALKGNYEDQFFKQGAEAAFTNGFLSMNASKETYNRLRAVIQDENYNFAQNMRLYGHKYKINKPGLGGSSDSAASGEPPQIFGSGASQTNAQFGAPTAFGSAIGASTVGGNMVLGPAKGPKVLSVSMGMDWVKNVLKRSRGTELVGNFNPQVISELFWEQSSAWQKMAEAHLDEVCKACECFVRNVLEAKAPDDVRTRVWSVIVKEALKERRQSAKDELAKLVADKNGTPINYNHYYTDTIQNGRTSRLKARFREVLPKPGQFTSGGNYYVQKDVDAKIESLAHITIKGGGPTVDMDKYTCEEVLDCLIAIYKVLQKVWIANVTNQVIERHVVRGLDEIFSPMTIMKLSDAKIEAIAAEPPTSKRQRLFLTDRIKKLEDGQDIFREVMGFSNGII